MRKLLALLGCFLLAAVTAHAGTPPIPPTAITADVVSRVGGAGSVKPSDIGMRLVEGRTANASFTLSGTYELLIAVSCPSVSAVQVVYQAGQNAGGTAATPAMTSHIRAVPDTTDASSNAAITKVVYVAGASTFNFTPAASSARRNYITSDWVPIRSVARTDGGTYSLFVIRTNIADGAIIVSGNGVQSFSNWATNPSGLIFRMRHITSATNYDLSVNWSGFNSGTATASNGSPIGGVKYICDGAVYPVAGLGDSITEGQGTYIGEGFGSLATRTLTQNNAQGAIFEWSNMGWAGQTYAQIWQNMQDAATQGVLPSVVTIPSFSPNSVGNRAITVGDIEGSAGGLVGLPAIYNRALISSFLKAQGTTPVWWTWMPTNSSVYNYGSSDSLRRADNDNERIGAAHGKILVDADVIIAGIVTGGQTQMNAAYTNDNIHPNDVGNAALAPAFVTGIGRAVGVKPTGALVIQ